MSRFHDHLCIEGRWHFSNRFFVPYSRLLHTAQKQDYLPGINHEFVGKELEKKIETSYAAL